MRAGELWELSKGAAGRRAGGAVTSRFLDPERRASGPCPSLPAALRPRSPSVAEAGRRGLLRPSPWLLPACMPTGRFLDAHSTEFNTLGVASPFSGLEAWGQPGFILRLQLRVEQGEQKPGGLPHRPGARAETRTLTPGRKAVVTQGCRASVPMKAGPCVSREERHPEGSWRKRQGQGGGSLRRKEGPEREVGGVVRARPERHRAGWSARQQHRRTASSGRSTAGLPGR